jgi:hypothetical protein
VAAPGKEARKEVLGTGCMDTRYIISYRLRYLLLKNLALRQMDPNPRLIMFFYQGTTLKFRVNAGHCVWLEEEEEEEDE